LDCQARLMGWYCFIAIIECATTPGSVIMEAISFELLSPLQDIISARILRKEFSGLMILAFL
jgi:hypothetical protein